MVNIKQRLYKRENGIIRIYISSCYTKESDKEEKETENCEILDMCNNQ